MTPMEWLGLAEGIYGLYQKIRAGAITAGITDEQLDAQEADYDAREARRAAEAHPADVRGADDN